MFVSDAGALAVFRYPLVAGLPVASPHGTLHTPYAPGSIATRWDGVLYVADPAGHAVDVYGPGAEGRVAPVRVLMLHRPPLSLALDADGFLYVGGAELGTVEIFAPDASGPAKPVGEVQLTFFSGTDAVAVNVDAGGRLFVGQPVPSNPAVVYEFANPRTAPTFLRALFGINGFEPFGALNGLATDASGELYVTQAQSQVWAFSESACCGYPADRLLQPESTFFYPVSIAVRHRHAYILSSTLWYGHATPAVYLFDVLLGTQQPVETIAGPYLRQPVAIAVTP